MAETTPSPERPAVAQRPFSARPRQRPLAAIFGIILVAAFSLWVASRWYGSSSAGSPTGDELTYRVGRGPLTISFTERGTIKAARSEQVFCQLEGSSTIVNVVAEGTYVKKGDLLVELDSSSLTQLYNQQAIAVEAAEAALVQAVEALAIQELQNESDVKASELAVELSSIDKKKYEEGDFKLAKSKADGEIYLAKEEQKRAENKYKWTKKLAEKGYVTGTELIADGLAVSKAKVQLEQADGAKEVLEKYTHEKDSRKVASDLEQAQRTMRRTRLKAESQLAQARADQKAKSSTQKLSERRLQKIKEQIEKTRILAPQDGMVVYHQEGRYGRDDRIIEQGATVRENQHLIDLPDLSTMAVNVSVPEARIHQVSLGLIATISLDAQNELSLRGTVTKIGLLPDYVNRWLNPDLKVYQTDITMDGDQDVKLLRPGMSAKAEILVAQLEDVLYVPIQSVTTVDGIPVAYAVRDGKFAAQRVELGLSNDSFVVIASGLNEGDTIQLNAPRPQGAPPKKKKKKEVKEEAGDGYPIPTSHKADDGSRRKRGKEKKEAEGGEAWKQKRGPEAPAEGKASPGQTPAAGASTPTPAKGPAS